MQRSEDFSDVVLWAGVGGPKIRGHKVILATGSNYFRNLFTANSDCSVFTITEVRFKELSMLVDFIYKGEISIALEDIDEFVKGAEKLEVLGLFEKDQDSRLNQHSDSSARVSRPFRHHDFSHTNPRESRNHSHTIANHAPESDVLDEDDEVVFIKEVNPEKQTSTPMVKLTYNSSVRDPVVSETKLTDVIAPLDGNAEWSEFNQFKFQENSSILEPRQVNLPPDASSTPSQAANNNNAPASNIEVDLSLMPNNTVDDEMWNIVYNGGQFLGSGTPVNNNDATQAVEAAVTGPASTAAGVETRLAIQGKRNATATASHLKQNSPDDPKTNVENEEEAKFKMITSKKWKCLQCGLVTNTKHNVLKHIRARAADHKEKPKKNLRI